MDVRKEIVEVVVAAKSLRPPNSKLASKMFFDQMIIIVLPENKEVFPFLAVLSCGRRRRSCEMPE